MKFGVAIVALAGCSGEGVPRTPTTPARSWNPPAPPAPPIGSRLLWVMVMRERAVQCVGGSAKSGQSADLNGLRRMVL